MNTPLLINLIIVTVTVCDLLNYVSLTPVVVPEPVDPDRLRMIPEFIKSRGFDHEPYQVITSDGYILGLHRIVNPLAVKYIPEGQQKPVLMQCGLLCSGSEFLDNTPDGFLNETMLVYRDQLEAIDFNLTANNNLGFVLANLGVDVWLFQPRGNVYSRNHTTLDPNTDSSYWEFTFDEISLLDLPTSIDFVLKVTGAPSVGYIGYSQGGTTIYALLSDMPEYSEKIIPVIAIAPAVRLDNYAGLPYQAILENRYVMNYIKSRGGECFGFQGDKIMERCDENFLFRLVCEFITYNLLTINPVQVDVDRVPVFLSHIPSGTSCWNILHLLQVMVNKSFSKFDYGKADNLVKYNSTVPPVYDLGRVTSNDMYIVASLGDHSADQKDIATLKSLLTSVTQIHEVIIDDLTFDHLDYFMSKNNGPYVNGPIAKILSKYY